MGEKNVELECDVLLSWGVLWMEEGSDQLDDESKA